MLNIVDRDSVLYLIWCVENVIAYLKAGDLNLLGSQNSVDDTSQTRNRCVAVQISDRRIDPLRGIGPATCTK